MLFLEEIIRVSEGGKEGGREEGGREGGGREEGGREGRRDCHKCILYSEILGYNYFYISL